MEKCELTPLTNMRSLLIALAKAMNLINPNMQHHHEQTAYISYQIGYEMGLRGDDLNYAVYAALLHDIGAVGPAPVGRGGAGTFQWHSPSAAQR